MQAETGLFALLDAAALVLRLPVNGEVAIHWPSRTLHVIQVHEAAALVSPTFLPVIELGEFNVFAGKCALRLL